MSLMLAVLEPQNMHQAYQRVTRNKSAAWVDGMTVKQLKSHLKHNWPRLRQQLLEGTYQPQPVRKVEIPKADGGKRMLGFPTVTDRLIQQAIHQVLSNQYDPHFSPYGYGFRPKRSAIQAVKQAQSYLAQGKRWVVDLDLEKIFDRVNHDILMSRLASNIKDKTVLKLMLYNVCGKLGVRFFRCEYSRQNILDCRTFGRALQVNIFTFGPHSL